MKAAIRGSTMVIWPFTSTLRHEFPKKGEKNRRVPELPYTSLKQCLPRPVRLTAGCSICHTTSNSLNRNLILIRSFKPGIDHCDVLAFSPDGRVMATGGNDRFQMIRLWNAESGLALRALYDDSVRSVGTLAFSPDGGTLASAGTGKVIKLWNVATGRCIRHWEAHADNINCVRFSPDGGMLASCGFDSTLKIWKLEQLPRMPAGSEASGPPETAEDVN